MPEAPDLLRSNCTSVSRGLFLPVTEKYPDYVIGGTHSAKIIYLDSISSYWSSLCPNNVFSVRIVSFNSMPGIIVVPFTTKFPTVSNARSAIAEDVSAGIRDIKIKVYISAPFNIHAYVSGCSLQLRLR